MHGFVFKEVTKPVDERDLQVSKPSANLLLVYHDTYCTHKVSTTNTVSWGNLLVAIFASNLDTILNTESS